MPSQGVGPVRRSHPSSVTCLFPGVGPNKTPPVSVHTSLGPGTRRRVGVRRHWCQLSGPDRFEAANPGSRGPPRGRPRRRPLRHPSWCTCSPRVRSVPSVGVPSRNGTSEPTRVRPRGPHHPGCTGGRPTGTHPSGRARRPGTGPDSFLVTPLFDSASKSRPGLGAGVRVPRARTGLRRPLVHSLRRDPAAGPNPPESVNTGP